MAAGEYSKVTGINNEITCIQKEVSGGADISYFGTDVGDVYKYNGTTAVLTKLGNVGGSVKAMNLYSSKLYCTIAGGIMATLTTA